MRTTAHCSETPVLAGPLAQAQAVPAQTAASGQTSAIAGPALAGPWAWAAAAEKRAYIQAEWELAQQKGRDEIEKKTAAARKAMGVRKNEANPDSIRQMIERWEMDMAVALYTARMMNAT